jgi:hypothetical protein
MVEYKSSDYDFDDPPIVYATQIMSEVEGTRDQWNCRHCTLSNAVSELFCKACTYPNPNVAHNLSTVDQENSKMPATILSDQPGLQPPYQGQINEEEISRQERVCPQCTFLNAVAEPFCEACAYRNPNVAHSPSTVDHENSKIQSKILSDQPGTQPPYEAQDYIPEASLLGKDRELNEKQQANKGHGFTSHYDANSSARASSTLHKTPVLEDIAAKKLRRRRRRRVRMVAGATAGLIVGSIMLGPFGTAVGAAGGAVGARASSKKRERKKDERVARETLAEAVLD